MLAAKPAFLSSSFYLPFFSFFSFCSAFFSSAIFKSSASERRRGPSGPDQYIWNLRNIERAPVLRALV